MQLTLDLSPILVNRTAVYDIGVEVDRIARARLPAQLDYQFVGHRVSDIPPPEEQRKLRDLFSRKLDNPERLAVTRHDPATSEDGDAETCRTFYLDPLYTLFGDLGPSDIVMCHDLSPITHPHWHSPNVGRLYERAFCKVVRSGCTVIADSENTADTFRANFGSGPGAVRTVHLYLPKSVTAHPLVGPANPRLAATTPYFLFVGSLEARKNIVGAIEAFRLSNLASQGYRLLIIGTRAHGAEEIERKAARSEGVVLCGFLSEVEKLAAYAGATGFVYPSYLEGFGIPLLEAMAFGIPSVTTVTGASPEVGGPDVPCLDPDDHHGIAAALRKIVGLSDTQRSRLGARLRKRAADLFSFERFASDIEDVLFA
jgi:glycosyltransferase involved in cell wall biosynthesis